MLHLASNIKRLKSALNWFQCQEIQDERLNSQLQTFSQDFKSKETEEKFFKHKRSQFLSQFRICTVFQICLNITFTIYAYTFFNSIQRSIMRAILTLCLFCFLIIQTKIGQKWNTAINVFIVLNTLANQIICAEYYIYQIDPPVICGFSVLTNTFYALSNFIICSSWQCQFSILLAYFIQFSGIVQNQIQWQPFVLMILLCLLLRINDKQIKLSFLLLNKQNINIVACKEVLDQYVPSSILIIKMIEDNPKINQSPTFVAQQDFSENLFCPRGNCEVLYSNKFAQKYLGCIDNLDCAQEIGKIQVNLQNGEKIELLKVIRQSTYEEMQANNQDYALGKESEILCCSRIHKIKVKTDYEFEESSIQKFCDLTTTSCVWEGQNAMLVSINDTTDKLQHIEQLKELNNYKDQLLATVSHDLKTPLNATQLMLYTIKEILRSKTSLDQIEIKNILQYVNDIISNNCMLISMINDLLDYSQIRKGSLRLQLDKFDLDDCLEQIKKIFQSQTQQKNLKLIFQKMNFDSQIELQTDQNRLKQILINLLSNSLKFTYVGHIMVKISILDSELEFIVEDTGIGMPKDVVVKLFQQYQTFNLGNMNQQGVGLGLVISQKLVGLLGPSESISVDSEEGVGTQFSFKIFICHTSKESDQLIFDEENDHQHPRMTRSTKTLRRMTLSKIEQCNVLIVDDMVFNITVLKVILQKSFLCNVEDAYNGQEALQKVKSGTHFDLIFMDISMPVMNGYQATKLIREYENKTNNQRSIIIICSAYTLEQEFENLRDSGANGLIEKPVSIQRLNEILSKYQFIN